jgi:hydroxymethylpyrimidine/phosphomethylpyrimidine kinase
MKGRVLIIAGSDSGGGAGIQADIKAVTALGGYAATAVTAITVQDTKAVHDVYEMAPAIVRKQIDVVLSDIGADVIKIGMIGSVAVADAVLAALKEVPDIPVVLDPVLVATSGDTLAGGGMAELFRDAFVPRAAIVTPNLPELHALSEGQDEAVAVADMLRRGAGAVLVKGGHEDGPTVRDRLYTNEGMVPFEGARIDTTSTHGTGCTLASAIAAGLAQGMPTIEATRQAIAYVHDAIEAAPGFGGGNGPIAHTVWNGRVPVSEES